MRPKTLVLHCLRCGHEWLRRNLAKDPKVCPNPTCKSPYWATERKRKAS